MNSVFFAGLDVHKFFVQACIVDGFGNIVSEGRFGVNEVGLKRLFVAVRNAGCVIESSTACFVVYDYLKDRGVGVKVAHPKRVKAICSGKVKTDKVDARTLAQLERANMIPEAYVPSREVRGKRELVRQHMALTRQHTRLVNQLKACLLMHGVKIPDNPFTRKAWRVAEVSGLSDSVWLKFEHAFSQHKLLKEQLAVVDKRIEEFASNDKDAVLLRSIRGIGWFSAFAIVTQVDGVGRFDSADKLVSYAGLCPSIKQSGSYLQMGGVGSDACKLLRWVLIQDAWSVVRFNPYFKRVYQRLCKRKGKQKAIVGVGKRLLRAMYFMLRDQTTFKARGVGC